MGFNCIATNTYAGFKCEDIDECMSGSHTCAVGENCINYSGSFACQDGDTTIIVGPGPTVAPTAPPATDPCLDTTCNDGWECVQVILIHFAI